MIRNKIASLEARLARLESRLMSRTAGKFDYQTQLEEEYGLTPKQIELDEIQRGIDKQLEIENAQFPMLLKALFKSLKNSYPQLQMSLYPFGKSPRQEIEVVHFYSNSGDLPYLEITDFNGTIFFSTPDHMSQGNWTRGLKKFTPAEQELGSFVREATRMLTKAFEVFKAEGSVNLRKDKPYTY